MGFAGTRSEEKNVFAAKAFVHLRFQNVLALNEFWVDIGSAYLFDHVQLGDTSCQAVRYVELHT